MVKCTGLQGSKHICLFKFPLCFGVTFLPTTTHVVCFPLPTDKENIQGPIEPSVTVRKFQLII